MKKNLFLFIFICIFGFSHGQSVFAPINYDYQHLLERYEIKLGKFVNNFHSHIKPYQRKAIATLADSVQNSGLSLSQSDEFNLNYLKNDNWEWTAKEEAGNSSKPVLKHFWQKQNAWYHHTQDDFMVQVNPVLGLSVGNEQNNAETPFYNTRGAELRGMISKKLGFYTFFTDTQALFPVYTTDRITTFNALPLEGRYKRGIGENQVDFITARGYITFDVIKNINLQFGYDKNFIGNGYRSLILSDNSSNYLFLKLNTNVWKINYQNLFTQLNAEVFDADSPYPKKYMAMHHLSINITKNFNLGLFETVMFSRSDTTKIHGDFRVAYLNPIIFYRSVEQQVGSPDNAMLGMDFKWHLWKKLGLYGQVVLDEFVISEFRNRTGWRGNKQALQLGLKYIDVAGISNLDLQAELNLARPYMYSHNFQYGEYSNYNQPLAHPLGANFYEFMGIVRYQPIPKLNLSAKLMYAEYGTDSLNTNWGSNIFLNNSDFEQEYDNKIGQGIGTNLLFVDFTASYQLKHNFFIDLKQIYRKLDSDLSERNQDSYFVSLFLRLNIPQRLNEF